MFETTLPASEPRTTFGSESEIAISAMISSGALPKLAFKRPPIRGPVCSPACSVASPMSHASGISAAAASGNNTASLGFATRSSKTVSGAMASEAQRSLRATGD